MQVNSLQWQHVKGYLPSRPAHCFKGDFGHVLVVGGAPGYSGATRLAAEAAARVGSGLVSVATHPFHAAVLNIGCPELMCHAVMHAEDVKPLLAKATVIALGPGLGQEVWGSALAEAILQADKPIIIDADGLNCLAKHAQKLKQCVLTPHVGEAARLLGITNNQVQGDRLEAVQSIQQQYGGVVVLKGSVDLPTLIASDNQLVSCHDGNPAMASGGMGDALTGIITGLVAQGLTLMQAAEFGVMLHAKTADYLVQHKHYRTLLAHDVIDHLPFVFDFWR